MHLLFKLLLERINIPYNFFSNVNMPAPYNANGAPFPVQIICPVCKT